MNAPLLLYNKIFFEFTAKATTENSKSFSLEYFCWYLFFPMTVGVEFFSQHKIQYCLVHFYSIVRMFFLAFCFSIFNGDCNNPDKIRKISIKFHYYERVTSNNLVNFLMHNLHKSLCLPTQLNSTSHDQGSR